MLQLAKSSRSGDDSGLTAFNALVLVRRRHRIPKSRPESEYRDQFLECNFTALVSSGDKNATFIWLLSAASISGFLEPVLPQACVPSDCHSSGFSQLSLGHPLGALPAPCGQRSLHFPASSPKTSLGPLPQNASLALGAGHTRVASRKGAPSDIRAKQYWRK
jgi:hypothetical protein